MSGTIWFVRARLVGKTGEKMRERKMYYIYKSSIDAVTKPHEKLAYKDGKGEGKKKRWRVHMRRVPRWRQHQNRTPAELTFAHTHTHIRDKYGTTAATTKPRRKTTARKAETTNARQFY